MLFCSSALLQWLPTTLLHSVFYKLYKFYKFISQHFFIPYFTYFTNSFLLGEKKDTTKLSVAVSAISSLFSAVFGCGKFFTGHPSSTGERQRGERQRDERQRARTQ